MADVTVCIPAYCSQQFIAQTLRSLQQQTYNNFHVKIAIEPTEYSELVWQACEPFLRDKRFEAQENHQVLGWSQNINSLLQKITTPYFAILPHDDIWHPEYLNILLNVLKDRAQASVAYADMFMFGEGQGRKFMPIKQGSIGERLLSFYLAGAEAVPWRGVTRSEVLASGNFFSHKYCNSFAVECQWAQHLLLKGDAIRVSQPLYFKRKFGTKLDTVSRLWIKSFDTQNKLEALENHRAYMFSGFATAPAIDAEEKKIITLVWEIAMLRRFFSFLGNRVPLTHNNLQRLAILNQEVLKTQINSNIRNQMQSRIELIIAKNALASQEYQQAEEHARQSVAQDQMHWEALLFLSRLLLKRNEVHEALAFAAQSAAIAPQCGGVDPLIQKCGDKIKKLYACVNI
ncbi:glycosyl transferase [Xenococcus sp. PCC 7305]|uniref:glycosyltransferase family 2 protein n=1 Tax=Xenococcus sp. PCC 7305 TaxID=102125 RepID=UPI0002AC3B3F|nr:glycosyltransferase family 2 protein [Xenococcus sp. PCC 7305]ELS05104.1 glycosyl transferase [Xenococcus sp. PCC 7305]